MFNSILIPEPEKAVSPTVLAWIVGKPPVSHDRTYSEAGNKQQPKFNFRYSGLASVLYTKFLELLMSHDLEQLLTLARQAGAEAAEVYYSRSPGNSGQYHRLLYLGR